ncbi:hypothetical protein [Lacrimispora sp. JR3]
MVLTSMENGFRQGEMWPGIPLGGQGHSRNGNCMKSRRGSKFG